MYPPISFATPSNSDVNYIIIAGWAVPPNVDGNGVVNLKIFYATNSSLKIFGMKLVILYPKGVSNSTGGNYSIYYLPESSLNYHSLNFTVTISNQSRDITFGGYITWFVETPGGQTLLITRPISFTLPYYGNVGLTVYSETPFVTYGLNKVKIVLQNVGTTGLKHLSVRVLNYSYQVKSLNSTYTITVPLIVLQRSSYYEIPVTVSYSSQYNVMQSFSTTISIPVLSSSARSVYYYNLLSPENQYLVPGVNYLVLSVNNTLGTPLPDVRLVISYPNGTPLSIKYVKLWNVGETISIPLVINASNSLSLNVQLLINSTNYTLYTLSLPIKHLSKLSQELVTNGSSLVLIIHNNLNVTLYNVRIVVNNEYGNNISVQVKEIPPLSSVNVSLPNYPGVVRVTTYFTALGFNLTETNVIPVPGIPYSSASNVSLINYYVNWLPNRDTFNLVLGFFNYGDQTAKDVYAVIVSNNERLSISPDVLYLGYVNPHSYAFGSTTIYKGNLKSVSLEVLLFYKIGNVTEVKEYVIVVKEPESHSVIDVILSYLGYSIYGFPLIFIVLIIIFIIIVIFPPLRKKK